MPHNYRPLTTLSTTLRILAVLDALIALVSIRATYKYWKLADEIPAAAQQLERVFSVQLIVQVAFLLLLFRWIYQANLNARSLGAEGMTFSAGASVGWFFAPLINFYKPCLAIVEIWKASHHRLTDGKWEQLESPPIIDFWWICFVCSVVAWRPPFLFKTSSDMMMQYSLVSDTLRIPAAILLFLVTREMLRVQQTNAEQT